MDANLISEAQRQFIQQYAAAATAAACPVSIYTFKGEHIQSSLKKEHLLSVLMRRERFVCDSNSSWKDEAAKIGNQAKAFIIGQTCLDEPEDVRGNLFGKKVDITNENIFTFIITPHLGGTGCLAIEQYNSNYPLRFNQPMLQQLSQQRVKKTDPKYLESEREYLAAVQNDKKEILSFLNVADIANVPSGEAAEQKQSDMVQHIRSSGPSCCGNYMLSQVIAMGCYAALLLEQDDVGKKTRDEFSDPKRRNVFGDLCVIRDALWFKARILSNDRAVARMAKYVALPEIKVTGMA